MTTHGIPASALVPLTDGGIARSAAVCGDVRRLVGMGDEYAALRLLAWCDAVAAVEGGWVGDSRTSAVLVSRDATAAYLACRWPVDVPIGAAS
jgi:hypothetical protein